MAAWVYTKEREREVGSEKQAVWAVDQVGQWVAAARLLRLQTASQCPALKSLSFRSRANQSRRAISGSYPKSLKLEQRSFLR